MSRAVKVEVTDKDIAAGKRNNAMCCPIALAVKRALGCDVRACWGIIELPEGKSAGMPKKYNAFIERFDAGDKVRPFSFVMRVPS